MAQDDSTDLIIKLRSLASAENFDGQTRFGIRGSNRLGVSLYDLRRLVKGMPRNHALALDLWASGIHEARMLAGMIEEPEKVDLEQLESWVAAFDSWDICDIVTDELFIHTQDALKVIPLWVERPQEFVKRAAFAMIAALVVHRKDIGDDVVQGYFALIEAASDDERNFVKKAVNWALRNIGKFRPALRSQAVDCANRLLMKDSSTAKWIAKDAIKEFNLKFGVQK